jgi:peroxiredoxin
MINDVKSSSHLMENYTMSPFCHRKDPNFIKEFNQEFNIKVLTHGNWIINSCENIKTEELLKIAENGICRELNLIKIISYFDNYYKHIFQNKIIYNNLFLGNCEILYKIKNRLYSISMTPFQAFFCVIYNKNKYNKNRFTFSEICDFFKIGDIKSLINSIIPLIKSGLFLINDEESLNELNKNQNLNNINLSSQTSTKENTINSQNNLNFTLISDKILISLNLNFFNKQQKLKISHLRYINEKIQSSEDKQGESVFLQRKYLIESNILRIMKSTMKISHNDLINDVLNSISNIFLPEISVIKQRIESLLERGYIKREEGNYNSYSYVL